jgi:serine/threonine-protein kinase
VAEFDGKYTDVYSLGAVFYRVLTGETPVAANLRRMNDTLAAAHTIDREVPGYVSAALSHAMRLAPEERMQSVTDLQAALTTPVKTGGLSSFGGLNLTQRQIKLVALAAAGLVLVAVLSIWAIFSSSRGKVTASSSSSSEESSSVSESESTPTPVTVPLLVGKTYKEISADSEYTQNFLFSVTYEYNSDYKEGEIVTQTPAAGVIVQPGTTIAITVSKGVQTVSMPNVVGLSLGDAKAALNAREIQYVTVPYPNPDGAYSANVVVQTDPAAGETVKVATDVVVLSVAVEPPAASSSETTASSSSTVPSSSYEVTTPSSSSSAAPSSAASSSASTASSAVSSEATTESASNAAPTA